MRKTKLLLAPLLVLPLMASCNNGPTEYKVNIPNTNGVIISPATVTKGSDYVGTISIVQDIIDNQVLPDALTKVTSGDKELQPKDYTYTLKEDKLSADFKIPATSLTGDVSIQLNLVTLKVNEEEFNAAVTFEDIEYLQCLTERTMSGSFLGDSTQKSNLEFSPNKFHSITTNEPASAFADAYNDTYTILLKDKLYDLTKLNKEDSWDSIEWVDSTSSELPVPTNYFSNYISSTISTAGLSYSSFEFKDGYYVFEGKIMECPAAFKLQFNNKKLVSYYSMSDMSSLFMGVSEDKFTFTYDENDITLPKDLPEEVSYEVTLDEFNAALAFTGVEYLQAESKMENEMQSMIQEEICSPNICYSLMAGEITPPGLEAQNIYSEKFVYKINETTFKMTSRDSEEGKYGEWVDADKSYDWSTPYSVGLGLANILEQIGGVEFDADKFDPFTNSYVFKDKTTESLDIIFKFKNKKLIYSNIAEMAIMEFAYDEIVPELPIPVPNAK